MVAGVAADRADLGDRGGGDVGVGQLAAAGAVGAGVALAGPAALAGLGAGGAAGVRVAVRIDAQALVAGRGALGKGRLAGAIGPLGGLRGRGAALGDHAAVGPGVLRRRQTGRETRPPPPGRQTRSNASAIPPASTVARRYSTHRAHGEGERHAGAHAAVGRRVRADRARPRRARVSEQAGPGADRRGRSGEPARAAPDLLRQLRLALGGAQPLAAGAGAAAVSGRAVGARDRAPGWTRRSPRPMSPASWPILARPSAPAGSSGRTAGRGC